MKIQGSDRQNYLNISASEIDIEALIAQVESQPLLSAPAYLKDEILDKSRGVSVQVPLQLEKKKKELSKRMQLLFYSLKISAAVVFCLFQLAMINRFPADMNVYFYQALDSYHALQMEQKEAKNSSLSFKETTDIGLPEKAGQSIHSLINQITNGGNDYD